jgi:hypothetical protein
MRAGSILQFIGGGLGRVALSGVIIGLFFVGVGMTPWQFVADFVQRPPSFITSPWFSPGMAMAGLVVIALSLWFNIWSRKQKVIDDLAEDISFAITDLLNRNPRPSTDAEIDKWDADYRSWCDKVSRKLENRSFFTRADQLHFDRLGFVNQVAMSGHQRLD